MALTEKTESPILHHRCRVIDPRKNRKILRNRPYANQKSSPAPRRLCTIARRKDIATPVTSCGGYFQRISIRVIC